MPPLRHSIVVVNSCNDVAFIFHIKTVLHINAFGDLVAPFVVD